MSMGQIEKDNLEQMVKNMSKEEKEIVVRALPIQLCYNRVGEELQKQRQVIKSLGEIIQDFTGSHKSDETKRIDNIVNVLISDDILKSE